MRTKILFPLFISFFFAFSLFAADGVFTNLKATNSTLTNTTSTNTTSTNTTSTNITATNITATNINFIPVFKNCSSNNQTYVLPASGSRFIMRLGATDKVMTITPSVVGHTIMGSSSYVLELDGETVELFLIGTTWYRR